MDLYSSYVPPTASQGEQEKRKRGHPLLWVELLVLLSLVVFVAILLFSSNKSGGGGSSEGGGRSSSSSTTSTPISNVAFQFVSIVDVSATFEVSLPITTCWVFCQLQDNSSGANRTVVSFETSSIQIVNSFKLLSLIESSNYSMNVLASSSIDGSDPVVLYATTFTTASAGASASTNPPLTLSSLSGSSVIVTYNPVGSVSLPSGYSQAQMVCVNQTAGTFSVGSSNHFTASLVAGDTYTVNVCYGPAYTSNNGSSDTIIMSVQFLAPSPGVSLPPVNGQFASTTSPLMLTNLTSSEIDFTLPSVVDGGLLQGISLAVSGGAVDSANQSWSVGSLPSTYTATGLTANTLYTLNIDQTITASNQHGTFPLTTAYMTILCLTGTLTTASSLPVATFNYVTANMASFTYSAPAGLQVPSNTTPQLVLVDVDGNVVLGVYATSCLLTALTPGSAYTLGVVYSSSKVQSLTSLPSGSVLVFQSTFSTAAE